MGKRGKANPPVPGNVRGPVCEGLGVESLPDGRMEEAANPLARCFHANLNFVDLFPGEAARARALPRMFATGLRVKPGIRSRTGRDLKQSFP
jgi:hypothetical protein